MVELVLEVAPAVLVPFAHQRAWSDRDLVGRGADHGFDVDPVGVTAEVVVAAMVRAVALKRRHQLLIAEAEFRAVDWIRELAIAL